jgi:hypothetical protein
MHLKLWLGVAGLLLTGCSTIYVGNVPFTTVEVCSEELASRLHRQSGCLPPTRAENAQGFYLARYRLQVSPSEKNNLDAVTSEPRWPSPVNLMPSWIGRAFSVDAHRAGDKLAMNVPSSGNLDFMPLGSEVDRPESKIKTEVLMTTAMTGAVQKKLSVGAEVNPAEVVQRALNASGLAAAAPSGLKDVLLGQVVQAGYQRQSTSAAQGAYFYVSMTPDMLDSLRSALQLCGWSLDVPPGQQKAAGSGLSSTSGPGEAIQFVKKANTRPVMKNCAHELAKDHPEISAPVTHLLSELQRAARHLDVPKVVGVVVGVAILRTVKGQSEMCSKFDISLVTQKGMRSPVNTATCDALRLALTNFEGVRPNIVEPSGKTEAGSKLSDEEKKQLLLSVHAEYASAAFKSLDVHDHTSILAIHWVPVQLP